MYPGGAPNPYGPAPGAPNPYGAAPGTGGAPNPYGAAPGAPNPYGAAPGAGGAPNPYGAPPGGAPNPYGAPPGGAPGYPAGPPPPGVFAQFSVNPYPPAGGGYPNMSVGGAVPANADNQGYGSTPAYPNMSVGGAPPPPPAPSGPSPVGFGVNVAPPGVNVNITMGGVTPFGMGVGVNTGPTPPAPGHGRSFAQPAPGQYNAHEYHVLRDPSDGAVYLKLNNVLRHIPNPNAFHAVFAFGLDAHNFGAIPHGSEVGERLPDDLRLIKGSGPEVYLVDYEYGNYRKRHITSGDVFTRLHFDWNKIRTVSNHEISALVTGEPIY